MNCCTSPGCDFHSRQLLHTVRGAGLNTNYPFLSRGSSVKGGVHPKTYNSNAIACSELLKKVGDVPTRVEPTEPGGELKVR